MTSWLKLKYLELQITQGELLILKFQITWKELLQTFIVLKRCASQKAEHHTVYKCIKHVYICIKHVYNCIKPVYKSILLVYKSIKSLYECISLVYKSIKLVYKCIKPVCINALNLSINALNMCTNALDLCTNAFTLCTNALNLCTNAFNFCTNALNMCTNALNLSSMCCGRKQMSKFNIQKKYEKIYIKTAQNRRWTSSICQESVCKEWKLLGVKDYTM